MKQSASVRSTVKPGGSRTKVNSASENIASTTAHALPQAGPLTRRRRLWRWSLMVLSVVLLGGGFWAEARYHLKRFAVVSPGILYRTGQPTELGLWYLAKRHQVRTVVCLRREDPTLRHGLLDLNAADGLKESEYVPQLGVRHEQWTMGDEAHWPFPTPFQFERFFELFDNPQNMPIAVHCVGGRHRTGCVVALYQLEYEGRPIDPVLAEMWSYDFGGTCQIQELNLRTYWRRPRPDAAAWRELIAVLQPPAEALQGPDGQQPDLVPLVRWLRAQPVEGPVANRLKVYLQGTSQFRLQLLWWLVDGPEHPLADPARQLAEEAVQAKAATAELWSTAAAVLADYGTPVQQQWLYQELAAGAQAEQISPRYEALVTGVTNRYTPNRLAYLKAFLSDQRQRTDPKCARYRFCDTAVCRLATIVDLRLHDEWELRDATGTKGIVAAESWIEQHPDQMRFSTLLPPTGNKPLRPEFAGAPEGPGEER